MLHSRYKSILLYSVQCETLVLMNSTNNIHISILL